MYQDRRSVPNLVGVPNGKLVRNQDIEATIPVWRWAVVQVYVGKGEKFTFISLSTIVFRENASGDTAHLIEMVNGQA